MAEAIAERQCDGVRPGGRIPEVWTFPYDFLTGKRESGKILLKCLPCMTSLVLISPEHKNELKELREEFESKARWTGIMTAAASFLIIGALIVIASASLCLTLPGVNVVPDIVMKAIVPASLVIIAAFPLIAMAV